MTTQRLDMTAGEIEVFCAADKQAIALRGFLFGLHDVVIRSTHELRLYVVFIRDLHSISSGAV
jgi:hypothetical protein